MSSQINRIVVLTGAGISAESGIQTFRAADGLWENHRVDDVATPEGFERNPILVQRFYNERRAHLQQLDIQPNAAHIALAKLEREFAGEVLVVTQNIDDLHERAGSHQVLHMHGELLKVRCCQSGRVYDWRGPILSETVCECCTPAQALRPHIVWFGEIPLEMDRIAMALRQADLFISIGTSGHVYPAAGFVREASLHGAHTVELNLEPSAVNSAFDEHQQGSATVLVPKFVETILATTTNE